MCKKLFFLYGGIISGHFAFVDPLKTFPVKKKIAYLKKYRLKKLQIKKNCRLLFVMKKP